MIRCILDKNHNHVQYQPDGHQAAPEVENRVFLAVLYTVQSNSEETDLSFLWCNSCKLKCPEKET
jgi:hypothetical protein